MEKGTLIYSDKLLMSINKGIGFNESIIHDEINKILWHLGISEIDSETISGRSCTRLQWSRTARSMLQFAQ